MSRNNASVASLRKERIIKRSYNVARNTSNGIAGNIANSIDAGDTPTARELLDAFAEEVTDLSGALMTSAAAEELVDAANGIEAGL